MLALQPTIAQMDKADNKEGKKSGGVEEQIKKLSDEGREAALKNDTSFLEKNTTDDYTFIGGTGVVLTKPEAIQIRKSGDVNSAIDTSDQKVRVHGNTALLTFTANVKGTMKDKDISGTYLSSQVWLKEGGNWKLAHMQSTRVP
jgi:hypothetical protein